MDKYQKLGFALIVFGLAGTLLERYSDIPVDKKILGMDYETRRKVFALGTVAGGIIVAVKSF